MNVVLIGSGNVATHLGRALYAAEFSISQVWSPNAENAAALAEMIEAVPISGLSAVSHHAELCIIAVKDDAIAGIARSLAGFKGLIVHTSGSVALNVFEELFTHYGVLYPLQTFSKAKAIDFKTIPLCVEANGSNELGQLKEIAARLSRNVQEVDSEKRRILHLSAVFACNFPNYLYAVAEALLKEHQLNFDMLRPLILETALKIQDALPAEVQTGPAIRNDEATMTKHKELLAGHPEYLEIYKTLSECIKNTRS